MSANAPDPNAPREFLSFTLGQESYAIDILKVQEIRGYETPTRIANTPDFIKGVVNLRGHIVPIVDLRLKLGMDEARYDGTTVVIILNILKRVVGMVVDGVSDVVDVNKAEVRPAPELGSASATEYILGLVPVAERMVVLLDIDCLIGNDLRSISSSNNQALDNAAA